MRPHALPGILACISVAACASVNVAPEMAVLSRSVSDVETSLEKSLAGQVATEHRARVAAIAAAEGTFGLSTACAELATAQPTASVAECRFETVVAEDAPIPTFRAEAVMRKLKGLETYVGALALIAGSQSEDEIVAALEGLTAAAGKLAEVSENAGLALVAQGLKTQAGPIERGVRASVERLRIRALRQLTGEYDADVQAVVSEARAILFSLGHDARYRNLHAAMTSANARLQDAMIEGDPARVAALALAAERAHGAFTDYAPKSDYAKLSAIALAHGALTRRLEGTAPREEIAAFIETIRSLADGLGEG